MCHVNKCSETHTIFTDSHYLSLTCGFYGLLYAYQFTAWGHYAKFQTQMNLGDTYLSALNMGILFC